MEKFRKIGRITQQQFFSYHTVGSENQIYLSFDMPLCEHAEQRVSVMVCIKSCLHFSKIFVGYCLSLRSEGWVRRSGAL